MDKTTADLLALAEGFLESNDILEHDLASQIIAELRRVTEPVTDAELAAALSVLNYPYPEPIVGIVNSHFVDILERLAREVKELQKELAEWKKPTTRGPESMGARER